MKYLIGTVLAVLLLALTTLLTVLIHNALFRECTLECLDVGIPKEILTIADNQVTFVLEDGRTVTTKLQEVLIGKKICLD